MLEYCGYWPYRLTVRTSPFQGGNRGSIPRRVMQSRIAERRFLHDPTEIACYAISRGIEKRSGVPVQ